MDDSDKPSTPNPPETDTSTTEKPVSPAEPFKLPVVEPKRPWYANKWLWIVLSVLFIGALLAGTFVYVQALGEQAKQAAQAAATPTPSPTPSKSTTPTPQAKKILSYEQKDLGVMFDYPSTWRVTDNTSADSTGTKGSLVRKKIQSPEGFTLLFDTLSYGGLGGTGPCERNVTKFALEGKPKIDEKVGVVSYYLDDSFVLNISSPTLEAAKTNCLGYQEIVKVREPTMDANGYDDKAYAVMFGTSILGEKPISTSSPSDAELKEAVAILTSLRKTN